jgi:hypothetical protein
MNAKDPFDRMVRYLDKRGRPFAACMAVVERWGTPWQIAARGPVGGTPLWPEHWPLILPGARGGGIAARLRRLSIREPQVDRLLPLLAQCHGWLSHRIIQWLLPFFQPFYSEVPAELAVTSPDGIAWTLFARVVEGGSPAALLEHSRLLDAHRLGSQSAPGDLIALHIAIEQLVSSWTPGIDRQRPPDGLPGGLRSSRFLAAYSKVSGTRRQAIDLLVRHSPLTRLVYADLVSSLPPASSAQALEPLLTAGEGAWMEIWLAQIARSFLAALLTPPPELKELTTVEKEIGHLRAGKADWGGFESWHNAWRLGRLERDREVLRQRIAEDVAGRFRLARLIEPHGEGSCLQRYLLLRLRLLDMLVRHLVTAWMPRLVRAWAPHADDPVARADAILLGGRALDAFDKALCKLGAREIGSILGQPRSGALRQDLFAFLNPPLLDEDQRKSLVDDAGLPEAVVRRLVGRFEGKAGAVRLPFRFPNESAAPPATLLARWLPALRATFPEADSESPPAADRLV